MKHTRAPWIYRQDEVIGSYGTSKHICDLTANFCDKEEKEANGKLIAASPVLYNLVEALAIELLQSDSYHRNEHVKMMVDDALTIIKQLN